MSDREQKIRARVLQIWEHEKRPDGRESEHWQRATREIDTEASEAPTVRMRMPLGGAGEAPPNGEPAGKTPRPGQPGADRNPAHEP